MKNSFLQLTTKTHYSKFFCGREYPEMFRDYFSHYLSLIGYSGFEYQKKRKNGEVIGLKEKEEMLRQEFYREISRISGVKRIDNDILINPITKWSFHAIISQIIINVVGEMFEFTIQDEVDLSIKIGEYVENNSLGYLYGQECFADYIYGFCEMFILKPKSRIISKNMKHEEFTICSWCGSRYGIYKHNNCPSCGGWN